MFADSVYIARRKALREKLRSGVVRLLGNVDSPINFVHNVHPFRQDSTFSYFFELSGAGLTAIIDVDTSSYSAACSFSRATRGRGRCRVRRRLQAGKSEGSDASYPDLHFRALAFISGRCVVGWRLA